MMNDIEFNSLVEKINRDFIVRIKLAELAGRKKINIKNFKELELFVDSIPDLYLEISINKPENAAEALNLIKNNIK